MASRRVGGSAGRDFRSLESVANAVVKCERCPRLRRYCEAVAKVKKREFRDWKYWGRPVPGFGDPDARLFVVGLAPAAHGGNRTGRVFTGDSSGNWLYEALHRYGFASQPTSTHREDGLRLTDCYIAAVARCAPPGNKPTPRELENCNPYLQAEMRLLVRTRIIVALGRIAQEWWLRAAGWAGRRVDGPAGRGPDFAKPAFAHGLESALPDGKILISSYHPSRQNTNTGRLTREMWYTVFRRVREILDEDGEEGRGRREE
ncbi:MAG: uracil-DNA glycosylase [Gemmatimonadetes bacterium]|nr:uracil-DNA glycosylase [Gemmatimonadota bacterium]